LLDRLFGRCGRRAAIRGIATNRAALPFAAPIRVMRVPGLDPGIDPRIDEGTCPAGHNRRRLGARINPRIKSGDGRDEEGARTPRIPTPPTFAAAAAPERNALASVTSLPDRPPPSQTGVTILGVTAAAIDRAAQRRRRSSASSLTKEERLRKGLGRGFEIHANQAEPHAA
jgi:hypothetical protein